nr:hypothetical protein [Tanacetum cinerariifolium]
MSAGFYEHSTWECWEGGKVLFWWVRVYGKAVWKGLVNREFWRESLLLDPHCFNVESDFVESLLNRDTFIDYFSKFDFFGELAHVNPEIPKSDFDFEEEICLIENLLYDNSFPRPPEELNAEIADTIIESIPSLPIPVQDGNSQREEIDIVTEMDDVLPPSVENEDDLTSDPLLEEADLFLAAANSIPPGIENVADDPEGDIRFLEELLINDSILSHESSDSNFEDNPSIPRPSPEPPDTETDAGKEIPVVMNDKDEDVDYSSFIIVMFDKVFSLLSIESEDTIFDPETRSGNTTTHADDSLPKYDSFCFGIDPNKERLINVMKNDISDNSSNDPLLEEADLFLVSDNSIPPESKDTIFDPGISVESQWYLIGTELSCIFLFIQILMKAQLRLFFPFALPKDK